MEKMEPCSGKQGDSEGESKDTVNFDKPLQCGGKHKRRILLCEQFTHKFALSRVRWSETLPRHSARFLAAPIRDDEKPNEDFRNSGNSSFRKTIDRHEFDRGEAAMPLFSSKGDNANSALVPVRDGHILSRGPNPTFHFEDTRKHGRNIRKSGQGGDFFSLIRRAKRAM